MMCRGVSRGSCGAALNNTEVCNKATNDEKSIIACIITVFFQYHGLADTMKTVLRDGIILQRFVSSFVILYKNMLFAAAVNDRNE